MLDNKGFDLWADGYDADVGITDDDNEYPFAVYNGGFRNADYFINKLNKLGKRKKPFKVLLH